MTQNSSSSQEGQGTLFFLISFVILAVIAWTFYHYNKVILNTTFVIDMAVALFAIYAIIQLTDPSYSFRDLSWLYRVFLPCLFVALCTVVLFRVKAQLDYDAIAKAQETTNYMKFSYGDIKLEQATLGFRLFASLFSIVISLLWCACALLHKSIEEKRGYRASTPFEFFSDKVGFMAFPVFIGVVLAFK